MVGNFILFQPSEAPRYHEKRKALSTVFYKSKIQTITECVKHVTMSEIRRH